MRQVADVPEHAPDQLRKRNPVSGAAVNVAAVPLATALLEQVLPQLIPASAEMTEPLPPEVFAETLMLWAKFATTV